MNLLVTYCCIGLGLILQIKYSAAVFNNSPPADNINKVRVIFFYGNAINDNVTYTVPNAGPLVTHQKFEPDYSTIFYIHGFNDGPTNKSVRSVVKAYLKRGNYNIIALDYAKLVAGNYFSISIPNTLQISDPLSTLVLDWFDRGLNLSRFHIIGHSLGAQLGGLIGREIIEKSGGKRKIRRITGLDPAGPGFYYGSTIQHISYRDAAFVDIIHGDSLIYGAPIDTGTVDFWPNGPKTVQPGCPMRTLMILSQTDLCSHARVWRLWVEGVDPDCTPFYGVSARSWNAFRRGNTDLSNIIIMGQDTPLNAEGDYYLQTNGNWPYSKGKLGARYEQPN